MQSRRHLSRWALALSTVLALACGGANEGVGRGTVLGVDREAGTVSIDHEDIPGLMQAMTMTFQVTSRSLLEGIEPGQQVEFGVREEGGRYTLTSLTQRGGS